VNIQNALLWLECRHGDNCTTGQHLHYGPVVWSAAAPVHSASQSPLHTSACRTKGQAVFFSEKCSRGSV